MHKGLIMKTKNNFFFSSKNPNNFCCIIAKILLILILSSCMTMPRNTKAQRNTSFYDTSVLKQHMKSLCDIFTKKCGVAKKIGTKNKLLRFSILALPKREKEHFFCNSSSWAKNSRGEWRRSQIRPFFVFLLA